ncbi:MAG: amidohydrolase family protein, partial [FCB group bacterium]|nr:amidohydrolase family protein [FCB group bacterium]
MNPKRILIQSPLVCATMNDRREEFSGGHILLEDGVITSIGPEEFTGTADETIDARTMVVLPGLINTHHHLYQSLTRNIPRMQNAPLFSWLTDHYQVWREIDAEAIDVSTRVGLLELMISGVTTSSDHLYLFPRQTTGELIDVEIEAARD